MCQNPWDTKKTALRWNFPVKNDIKIPERFQTNDSSEPYHLGKTRTSQIPNWYKERNNQDEVAMNEVEIKSNMKQRINWIVLVLCKDKQDWQAIS